MLDRIQFAAGAQTTITVTLRNQGNIGLRLADAPCSALRFEVRAPEGDLVYPSGGEPDCIVLGPTERTIAPGSELSVTHRWAAIEGYGTPTGSGEPLGPGLYRVIPVVELESRVLAGDSADLEITP